MNTIILVMSVSSLFSLIVNITLVLLLRRALNAYDDVKEQNDALTINIENAFHSLNDAYSELSHAATANVLYDDPTVRRIVASMKACRASVMNIMKGLSSLTETDPEEKPDVSTEANSLKARVEASRNQAPKR